MFSRTKENAGFLAKHLTSLVGSFLLFLAGKKVNKNGAKKRLLVVFGGGIGDVAIGSIACGYLKEYLKEYDAYYLTSYKFKLPYAKEHILFNYHKAKKDPFYYFQLVNRLRNIGFSEVVVIFPFWEGFLASLASDVKSERVFCYKEAEPNAFCRITSKINYFLRYFSLKKRLVLITVASGWDKNWLERGRDQAWPRRTFPSIVGKQAYFVSQAIKTIKHDVPLNHGGMLNLENPRTEIVIDPDIEREYLDKIKNQYGLDLEKCCILGLGTSIPFKNWPVERFVEVAKALEKMGLKIVIADQLKDKKLVDQFTAGFGNEFYNLGFEADIERLMVLIKHSFMVLANDTSFIHLAIALQVPSICVLNNEGMGAYSFYGYEDINKWVFDDTQPVSSVLAVQPEAVIKECQALINYKKAAGGSREEFRFHYGKDYDYS